MIKTFINALKIKDIRTRLLFTLYCLVVVRIGCQLPVPGINHALFTSWLSQTSGLGFLDALTGGSFTELSIFALNISPYITSSIIMQLLTIAIPKLEEMQKDGETGRKKIAEITRYVTIGLALFESIAMGIGFNGSGYIKGNAVLTIIVITASFTAGSAFLMWLGEQITEKGIGNGISVILLINIVAKLPSDYASLFEVYVKNASRFVTGALGFIVIVAVTAVLVVLIILLQDAQRRISVQYAKKMQGRKMVGGQSSFIPLRVNTAGVIPVIFAVSLLQTPIIVSSLVGTQAKMGGTVWQEILMYLSQQQWCKFTTPGYAKYSVGLLLYIALIIFFAYFYTAITFNPAEVSNNLKKQGGFIPGIRPGRPTTEYLTKVLNYVILIGAVGLTIVALIPIVFTGIFPQANVSFGGTSVIIIVGVILEMMNQVESMMRERHYKGFLTED